MAGEWSSPDVAAVVRLFLANHELLAPSRWLGWAGRVRDLAGHALKANTRRGSRANIRAHYDLSNDFYSLFLDPSMTYSAAYFSEDSTTLAAAQQAKYERLALLAGITPGDDVLEIGCGWGGFAVWAASRLGCRVTGLTLSEAQADFARELVRRKNLDHLVEVRIQDYRDVAGSYDALVSIEMLEAVGHRYLGSFFAACERNLRPGGRVAIQVITIPDQRYTQYRRASDWIRKYIFPGGHLPSLGAMQQAMARSSRLVVEKAVDIAPHYAETLRRWRRRFLSQTDRVRSLGFDATFLRMWEFYLASCEAAFATRHLGTLQLALVRSGEGLIDRRTILGGDS
jgi:cyclopropane-fatty-acyl-phospholipid synthase